MGSRHRTRSRVLVVAALALIASAATAPGAVAHGDDGRMQLEATANGSLQAFVRATIIYENDSEPALGAAVSVDALGPDGQTVPSTPLAEAGDGRYEATITFPVAGAWTVRATATDPTATGEVAFTAAETAAVTTTTTAPDVEVGESRQVRDDADGGGSGLALPIVVLVVLGVGGGVGAWLVQRRRADRPSGE